MQHKAKRSISNIYAITFLFCSPLCPAATCPPLQSAQVSTTNHSMTESDSPRSVTWSPLWPLPPAQFLHFYSRPASNALLSPSALVWGPSNSPSPALSPVLLPSTFMQPPRPQPAGRLGNTKRPTAHNLFCRHCVLLPCCLFIYFSVNFFVSLSFEDAFACCFLFQIIITSCVH